MPPKNRYSILLKHERRRMASEKLGNLSNSNVIDVMEENACLASRGNWGGMGKCGRTKGFSQECEFHVG